MKFFYADALDLVDPGYDFRKDKFSPGRMPQRDDVYAHELMTPERPYDGLLVSRFLLDGRGSQGRYTMAQRQRFVRNGAQRFLRFPADGRYDPDRFPILCDCGAFNYRNDHEPPYSVEDMVEFYELGGFTHGVSVDHMIGTFDPMLDHPTIGGIPAELQRRYDITVANAERLRSIVVRDQPRFTALGVAQGWSPESYARAVQSLIAMGYDYVALGGLVPLKTREILAVLEGVKAVTAGKTKLHLFGITRLENFQVFRDAGVASFDSTSPLRQAFKDAKDNYYSASGHYSAVRVPQADVYPKLVRRIRKGEVERLEAVRLERACLESLYALDRGEVRVSEAMEALRSYEGLFGGNSKWAAVKRTLEDKPWQSCECPICREIGIDVVIFRGANRNRRRGFHNLLFTQKTLHEYRTGSPADA
ncbi:MAG: tRNA-guanine transglycosylase DpdA [Myxococcota bacterium]|nr:tRNA-guanine transglycosylase DpdA [Myxococcota bacterium]